MNESNSSTPGRIANLGAIILCGGKSSRMGIDKSQLIFQDQTLLDRVISRVSTVSHPVVVVSGDSPNSADTKLDVVIVKDEAVGLGPLEGIRVGLKELGRTVEFAFVTGCDAPLLEPALITHLFGLVENHEAVIPVQQDRVFGITAIYRTDIVDKLAALIDQQKFRVMDLAEHLDAFKIDVESLRACDPELESLTNINSREDYRQLLHRFGEKISDEIA